MAVCAYCNIAAEHDRRVCRMRKLHADPVFAKAAAERMRKLHADPVFAKAADWTSYMLALVTYLAAGLILGAFR